MLNKYVKFGGNLIYSSRRNVPESYQIKVLEEARNAENASGYVKVDLHTSISPLLNMKIKAKVRNVLDARIFSPAPMVGWKNMIFNGQVEHLI